MLKLPLYYIIGNLRYQLYKINPKLIRKHIREQVEERSSACSPPCVYEARCCGCSIPEVYFADKPCKHGNYGKFYSKEEWNHILKIKELNKAWDLFFNSLGQDHDDPYEPVYADINLIEFNEYLQKRKDKFLKNVARKTT